MPRQVPVSVAIPVYNGGSLLAGAIESVLDQTVTPVDFRVYDNASTDGSAALAARLLTPASVVTSENNLGAVANFNRAVEGATQPYFMWLSADDRLAPSFVEKALVELESDPEAPACLTSIQFIDAEGAPLYIQADAELASTRPRERIRPFLRRRRWTEFYCLYRTAALRRSPLAMDRHGSDVLLTWWFLLRGPFAVSDEPLLQYRVTNTKTMEEMTESLAPGSRPDSWLKVKMWLDLWRLAGDADVPARVRRTARQELSLVLLGTAWWYHLAEDVTLRWPWLRQLAGRFITLPRVARPRPVRDERPRFRALPRRRHSR